jgi:hypothetical protein
MEGELTRSKREISLDLSISDSVKAHLHKYSELVARNQQEIAHRITTEELKCAQASERVGKLAFYLSDLNTKLTRMEQFIENKK